MKCPYCNHQKDKVIDSREINNRIAVRRRRECLTCGKRFTTYEHIEGRPLALIKKDGRRESFDRNKMIKGIATACEKRPIGIEEIERIVNGIQAEVESQMKKEVESGYLGEMVMNKLRSLDEVAYVRFASVYRQFKTLEDFTDEVKKYKDNKIIDK